MGKVDKTLEWQFLATNDDPRLKIIEVILMSGGILGIIITLQQSVLPQYGDVLTAFILIFIVSSIILYSGIILHRRGRIYQLSLTVFRLSFSALLTLSLCVIVNKALAQFFAGLVEEWKLSVVWVFIFYLIIYVIVTMGFYFLFGRFLESVLKDPSKEP